MTSSPRSPRRGVPVDIVVIHLIGNNEIDDPSGPTWNDPTWADETIANARVITRQVLDYGTARGRPIDVYWVVPPVASFGCTWGDTTKPWANGRWAAWHTWIRDTLVSEYPGGQVHTVDWHTPFGGDSYSSAFTFPDGVIRQVRRPDCTHFTVDGGRIAAIATAIALQDEWVSTTAAPSTTTTTTTTTQPATTTTTVPSTTTTIDPTTTTTT